MTTVSTPDIDPVDAEIFQRRLFSIANEMGLIMIRTTGDPVIAEAVDFSTFIADATGELIAYSSYSAWHFGPAQQTIRHLLATYATDEIRPGDAFICNDPHTTGALHAPDIGIVRPIFAQGELVAWCWAEAHVADVGGMTPGGMAPDATESYQEGLRFPGIRIATGNVLHEDLLRLIRANFRIADRTINNLRCFMAACNTCDTRIQEVVAEYGPAQFVAYNELNKTLSETAVRSRIASLPDGTYRGVDYVEHDRLYEIVCEATVDGDSMRLDFTGTSPQAERFINQSLGATLAVSVTPMLFCLAPDVPINDGAVRAFELVVPEGSILNPVEPAPVSAGHIETGMRVSKLVARLLAQMQAASDDEFVRDRVLAPCQECFSGVLLYAPTPGGELVPFLDMNGGGGGLGAGGREDGLDVGGGLNQLDPAVPDVEVNETFYPVLYLWRRINQGSGGPGTFRGGQGLDFAWTPWDTPGGGFSLFVASSQVPPSGVFGGLPGGTCRGEVLSGPDVRDAFAKGRVPSSLAELGAGAVELLAKDFRQVSAGDVVAVQEGGGGGMGDPLDRQPALVARDVSDGYVSGDASKAVYGVVLGSDGAVDAAATDALRAERRSDRRTWESEPADTSRVGSAAVCQCGASLESPANLPSRRSPLAARMGEYGTWVGEHPGVTLVERACASCGTLVVAEVAVATAA
jgi:N-methylhydantoinase B